MDKSELPHHAALGSHIHAASNLDDLRVPPSNRLEKLKRDRRGQ